MTPRKTPNFQILFFTPIGLVSLLTMLTLGLSIGKETSDEGNFISALFSSLRFWKEGFFSLLAFTLQMMMVLAFGFAIAICQPINDKLKILASWPKDLPQAAILVAGISQISGLLNWGFGLIIGALMASFVHEALIKSHKKSNLELLAACGYLGMVIWHGGLSASSLLSIAEEHHGLIDEIGIIPVSETILSFENLLITLGLIGVFCLIAWSFGRIKTKDYAEGHGHFMNSVNRGKEDRLGFWLGIFLLLVLVVEMVFSDSTGLSAISLNWVIFLLFGLTLFIYRSWDNFLLATREGLKSSLDIFIQFPFYGGIMGIILGSGLLVDLANWTASWANENTFPLFTFYSAAVVNFFIPSGGGQWAVQGPLIMKTAEILELSYAKMSLAFAYGDQISNLLQPFWALPLLSITGVSVRKLIPYCFIFFLVGLMYLSLMIWFFL